MPLNGGVTLRRMPHQLLRRPYGSNGNAAATIAITMYSAAQMKIGTGVLVCMHDQYLPAILAPGASQNSHSRPPRPLR